MSQVDLDALRDAATLLTKDGLNDDARLVYSAIAELREARELLACATEFEIGIYAITKSADGKWCVDGQTVSDGKGVFSDLHKALATAREWEKANA